MTQVQKPQSLMTGEEGFTTVMLTAQRIGIPKAVAVLAGALNIAARALGKIKEVRGGGVVADVPTELVQALLTKDLEDVKVSLIETLPEIIEERAENRRPSSGGYGAGGSSSGGGKRYGSDRPSGGGNYGSREGGSNRSSGGSSRDGYRPKR